MTTDLEIMQEFSNLREWLEKRAEQYHDKTFLFFINEESGRKENISYAAFDKLINKTANALVHLGAKSNDIVGILLPNCPEFYYTFYGAIKIGALACPINALLKPPEVQYQLSNADIRIVVTVSNYLPMIESIKQNLPSLKHVVVVDKQTQGALYYNNLIENADEKLLPLQIDSNQPAAIFYTSGTTGNPKGVLLSHRNLLNHARQLVKKVELTSKDRGIIMMPLFFTYSINNITPSLLDAGASLVLLDRFSPKAFWDIILEYKVTALYLVGTHVSILLDLPLPFEKERLSFIRYVFAALLSIPVIERFENKFGLSFIDAYGLSEACACSLTNPLQKEKRKKGSVGILNEGMEAKIVDDNFNPLPPGQVGELILKGPTVMLGYFKDPKATEETIRDGWLKTGDNLSMDEDGYFYFVDRKKDMIKRGGMNIYAGEVEKALYAFPKTRDAAVIGTPHKKYVEEVVAFVTLRDGESATEEEIVNFCKERLADYKIPRKVIFKPNLPLTASGKIHKPTLREEAAALPW